MWDSRFWNPSSYSTRIKDCLVFRFGALEGKGNIAVLQMQLQPLHLIMILLNKKYPHGNKHVWWRKPQLIPLLLFQLKIQRRKEPHSSEWETCSLTIIFKCNLHSKKPIGMTSPEKDICFPFEWGLFSLKQPDGLNKGSPVAGSTCKMLGICLFPQSLQSPVRDCQSFPLPCLTCFLSATLTIYLRV